MDSLILQAIVAKFGGQFSPQSRVLVVGANDTETYPITIPENYVAYLLEVSAYAQGENIEAELRDSKNFVEYTWDEYIDTQKTWTIIPFTENFYTDSVTFKFINSGAVAQTIGWSSIWILILEADRPDFEAAIEEVGDLIPLLKSIDSTLITIYRLTRGEPAIEEEPDPILKIRR